MALKREFEMGPSEEFSSQRIERQAKVAEVCAQSIGRTMGSAAQTVQNTIRQTKKTAQEAVGTITDGIDTSAEYLTARGVGGVFEDAETLIRRHPFQALLIGLSLGYLFSRSRQP